MVQANRERTQQVNRMNILRAAERVFSEVGVEGASLDDVAAEAGLTKGAVYSNFKNKGDLILEVIRFRQTESPEALDFEELLDDKDNDLGKLEKWCDLWISASLSGERETYSRLFFEFIPYALRDAELTRRLLEFLTPHGDSDESSLIPPESNFSAVPVADQSRIFLALDIGLSALRLFDEKNVQPELYRTAILAMAHTAAHFSDREGLSDGDNCGQKPQNR